MIRRTAAIRWPDGMPCGGSDGCGRGAPSTGRTSGSSSRAGSPPFLALPFADLPTEEPETAVSYALTRFLLGPDPATSTCHRSGWLPACRRATKPLRPSGLWSSGSRPAAPGVRACLTELLTRTDEPHLLAALERAFTLALQPGRYGYARAGSIDEFAMPPLWNGPETIRRTY